MSFTKRRPIRPILQSASAECGLACAGMLIESFKRNRLQIQSLRRRYDVTLRGMSLSSLIQILSDHGMMARPLSVGLDRLKNVRLPCILHWRFNHFVVLEKISKRYFHIVDPAVGSILADREELDQNFTGVVVEVTDTIEYQQPEYSAKILRLSDLFPITRGLLNIVSQVFLLTIVFNGLSVLSPLMLKIIYDEVLPKANQSILPALVLGFVALALVQGLTLMFRGAALIEMRRNLSEKLSVNVFAHLLWLSSEVVERRSAGTIATNYRSITALTDTLSEDLLGALVDGISALVLVGVLLWIDPVIGGALAVLLSLHAGWLAVTAPGRKARLSRLLACEGQEGGFFVETVARLQPIRVFGAEGLRLASFANQHDRLEDSRQKLGLYSNTTKTFGEIIVSVGWVLIIALSAMRTIDTHISVGTFAATVVWIGLAVARGREAIARVAQMDSLDSHVDRIADIMHGASDRPHGTEVALECPSISSFGCNGVSYRYGDDGSWLLKDCSFTLERGQWLSIIGESGVGKSTLVKILTGLVQPVQGSIMANGQALDPEVRHSFRRHIGVVMQNDGLFGGSLRDNITFYDVEPDIEQMHKCAIVAGIHGQIQKMPMKYETPIGEQGAGLSAGQLQRIMLARALYRRPDVLILDEFTANLDEAAEAAIIQSIKELGIAVLAIAHRRAVIEAANFVLKLEAGELQVVADGQSMPLYENVTTNKFVPLRAVGV